MRKNSNKKTSRLIKFAVVTALIAFLFLIKFLFIKLIFSPLWYLIELLWYFLQGAKNPPAPSKSINKNGYYVLANGELEHRHLAIQLLNRPLEKDEVVHHINGRKRDNRISNLCVMNDEEHEVFHAWLLWKKQKSGNYPSLSVQRERLERRHGGILLE